MYVYDRDRHLKQDKVLGKVAIKREELNTYHNKDHWFAIRPVDADSEVQGKANIELKFDSSFDKNGKELFNNKKLRVRVLECSELTLKNNTCDPYALVTVTYSNGKKSTKRTKVRKKTVNPQFEEVFIFESYDERERDRDSTYTVCPESEVEICELNVSVWHDSPGMADNVFLGEVRIPIRGQQQQNAAATNAW